MQQTIAGVAKSSELLSGGVSVHSTEMQHTFAEVHAIFLSAALWSAPVHMREGLWVCLFVCV